MSSKEIKTYKPKQSNIVKLEAYLKQIKDHGKQHILGNNLRK